MAKKSAPDPRFDPRFQRGYDGPEPPAPSTPAVPSPIEAGTSSRGIAEPPTETAAAREAGAFAEAAVGSNGDESWSPPRRNPFAISLLIGGLALIGVGLWLIWTVASSSSYPDGYNQAAVTFTFVQQTVSPAVLLAGLVGVIGWLVLGALAASARKDE